MNSRIENGEIATSTEKTVNEARKLVRNRFGEQFAAKASEALCLALSKLERRADALYFEGFREDRPAPTAGATIIEFAQSPAEANVRPTRPARESTAWKSLEKALERYKNKSGVDTALSPNQLWRQVQIRSIRDNFYHMAGVISDEIERGARGHFRPGPESLASPTTPSAVTEICWLNNTVRTWVDPSALVEIAADTKIERVDLPHRLTADINVTGNTVGVTQFRTKTSCTGKGVLIAIIDGEVALQHPAFQERVIHKQNHTLELWGNPNSHGTAVAGIVAAADVNLTGMAPSATIYNYKVLATNRFLNADDFGGTLAIQQALEDGVHIANCSWGAGKATDGTSREARACNAAWALGLTIVKSAGNRGPDAGSLTTPADAEGIVVVGATDQAGETVQNYSSRGPTGHGQERPHMVAPGGIVEQGINSCLVGGGFGDCGHGTSYAAPHVTGLLALILENEPNLAPDQLRQRLLDCCTSLGDDNNAQGAGIVSLSKLL